jgi:hypothetical protein
MTADVLGMPARRTLSSVCGEDAAGLAARSLRRSKPDRGRNSCKSEPGRGTPRTETAWLAALRLVRIRRRHVDELRDSQDNDPACVPSTVWGAASSCNRQVDLGAVLALR